MGTAIKHPARADRVKPSIVIFDIWALCGGVDFYPDLGPGPDHF